MLRFIVRSKTHRSQVSLTHTSKYKTYKLKHTSLKRMTRKKSEKQSQNTWNQCGGWAAHELWRSADKGRKLYGEISGRIVRGAGGYADLHAGLQVATFSGLTPWLTHTMLHTPRQSERGGGQRRLLTGYTISSASWTKNRYSACLLVRFLDVNMITVWPT